MDVLIVCGSPFCFVLVVYQFIKSVRANIKVVCLFVYLYIYIYMNSPNCYKQFIYICFFVCSSTASKPAHMNGFCHLCSISLFEACTKACLGKGTRRMGNEKMRAEKG